MKHAEIPKLMEEYGQLVESIPDGHPLCLSNCHTLLEILRESLERQAELEEQNAYLRSLAFGNKNKSKEASNEADGDSESSSRDKEAAAHNRRLNKKRKRRPRKKPRVRTQKVRRRVPKGLCCKACGLAIVDKGLCQKAEELALEKMRAIHREFLLHRGACGCGAVDFVMPRPSRVLPGRLYCPELLAKLIVDRYRFHLPVYRQCKQLEDHGIFISRTALNEALLGCWPVVEGLVKRIGQRCRAQSHRYVDETPICRIIDKKTSKRYYLFGMETTLGSYFMLSEHRNREVAKKFIGSGGTVLTDGLRIYGPKSIDGKHANCLAHLFQKILRGYNAFPDEADKALGLIHDIYAVDHRADADGLTPAQRKKLRQSESRPIMASLRQHLSTLNPPPRSQLGKAIEYALTRWEELSAFLDDGELLLDNNDIESRFKDIKLGMKNCLFVQSDRGGDALAGFYTLIVNAERYGLNPYDYVADVLRKLSSGWPQAKIDELLPWNWHPEMAEQPLPTVGDYIEDEMSAEEVVARLGLGDKVEIRLPVEPETQSTPVSNLSAPPGRTTPLQ